MHSDPEAIQKSVRTYMMIGAALFVFTVHHRGGQPGPSRGAAGHHGRAHHRDDKGSMVAACSCT